MSRYSGPQDQRRQAAKRSAGNRTEAAIRRCHSEGKSPRKDKRMAEMMDRLYGTDYVKRHHSKCPRCNGTGSIESLTGTGLCPVCTSLEEDR